jgi:dihydrofolate reductase
MPRAPFRIRPRVSPPGERDMRTLYFYQMLSLDGFFEGPGHDLSWHHVDAEMNRFAVEMLRATDLYLMGRRDYELMESYWSEAADDPTNSADDLEIARSLNETPKIVFSRTLAHVREKKNWHNVRLERDVDPAEIRKLKEGPGKEISIGGSTLAVTFAERGLIDEYRFLYAPVAIGAGTPVLGGIKDRLDLKLLASRSFASGKVLLTYRPASK